MKRRLKDAIKLEQEILRETAASYAAAAADPNPTQALANAVQLAVQLHGDEVSEFLQDVPAAPITSGEVVPSEAQRGDREGGWTIRDTLASPHAAAIAASLERSELLSQNSSVPTLFEEDQLLIGNVLDVVGYGLCK